MSGTYRPDPLLTCLPPRSQGFKDSALRVNKLKGPRSYATGVFCCSGVSASARVSLINWLGLTSRTAASVLTWANSSFEKRTVNLRFIDLPGEF